MVTKKETLPNAIEPGPNEYRCEECGGIFERVSSDEECIAEAKANGFGDGTLEQGGMAIVCDDCYNAIVERNRHDPRSHFHGK